VALAKRTLGYLLFLAMMVSSVSCDQGTKSWARRTLSSGDDVSVISGFWDFHLAQNPGGAFSTFRDVPGGRYVLTAVGVVLLAMIVAWMRRGERPWLSWAALGLIAGGAIGNLYDRIAYGSVTDFVYWHWRSRPWPVFNVADAMLLVGGVLLLISGSSSRAPRPAGS
jgi:signal peptidase II